MGASPIQPAEIDTFIAAYAVHHNFTRACREIGRSRKAMIVYFERSNEARERLEEVDASIGDELEEIALTRAKSMINDQSNALLMKLLAARKPMYRDKSTIDHTSSDGSMRATDTQLAARLASVLALAEQRKARGEVIDAEFTDTPALPVPKLEDLL